MAHSIGGQAITQILLFLLAASFLLLLVVGIHELGHFVAARLFHVKVKRFSIGLGRPILTRKSSRGVEWAISWFPFGGYVQLLDEREQALPDAEKAFAFNRKPIWVRLVILIAGPLANLVLAVLILSFLFCYGIPHRTVMLGNIEPGSVAYKAGLKRGDEITNVGNYQTPTWPLLLLSMVSHSGDKAPITIVVKREGGVVKHLHMDLSDWHLQGANIKPLSRLGISLPKKANHIVSKYDFFQSLDKAYHRTVTIIALNMRVLMKVITGQVSFRALAGPIAIFDSAATFLMHGVLYFLQFIALLSIAVGIVNLLPIPGLDGGQILYCVIEFLSGKPISVAWQLLLFRLSMCAIFVLFMQLLANDLNRIAGSLS